MTAITWEQWLANLKAFIADQRVLVSWIKSGADIEQTLTTVGKNVREWRVRNPEPPNPRRPPKPPVRGGGAAKVGEGLVDVERLQQNLRVFNQTGNAGNAIRTARALRQTERGLSSLGCLVALGAGPLLAVGAFAVKFAIESAAWDVAEGTFIRALSAINQAVMPATRAQAEAQYNAYVWNIKAHWSRFGPNVLTIQSKEDWLMEQYGVDWGVLR